MVDLDADGDVARCYAHLVVGLRGHHRDFDIDPARAPNGYDMLAFREFVRAAYPLLPPGASVALPCKSGGGGTRPWLMLILRGRAARATARADQHGVLCAGAVVLRVIRGEDGAPTGRVLRRPMTRHHVASDIAAAEESTLYEQYDKDHPVIADPACSLRAVATQVLWREQNIRLNTTRFAPTLQMVKRMLSE
ncbi:unnamed protein product [Miscanthus lutarioriparius]|uniref:Uncharacterized protein n=1 Tax=Miscanthus lutarioriparius TaxID=422564 RepID=A0A811Q1N1_9POAL|nr:unnamed protein product [Miscanthus lutarioriparius]